MFLRGSWGVGFVHLLFLLNERFWGCLKSYATIPLLNFDVDPFGITSSVRPRLTRVALEMMSRLGRKSHSSASTALKKGHPAACGRLS